MTTENTPTEDTAKTPKSATITLHAADGSVMQLVAERKGEAARTYVLTTGAGDNKKTSRGMSTDHATWDAALTTIAKLAIEAGKGGWTRKTAGRTFAKKPDAFSTLPTAPKAPTKAAPKAAKK